MCQSQLPAGLLGRHGKIDVSESWYDCTTLMLEHLQSDEAPEYYVDSVRIAANLYSFVLELGLQGIADSPQSEKPPIKRIALVRMSPHHALVLAKILQRNIDKYQQDVGPINVPDKFYGASEENA